MTSVLYRAKRKDNFEWVEGYYVKIRKNDRLCVKDMHFIITADATVYSYEKFSDYVEIIPETLCRLLNWACYDAFQEVTKLFQNDILAIWELHADVNNTEPMSIVLAVDETTVTEDGLGRWFPQDTTRIKIIGNAYDNPELLKGHGMNHFVNSLKEYSGTSDEYLKQHRYLTDKYGIHGAHAGCYLCNFENDYICHRCNGGCKRIHMCRDIREQERLKQATDVGD